MSLNADLYPYSEILTDTAFERGSGGPFFNEEIAPPVEVATQAFSYPVFGSARSAQGKISTIANADGTLNLRTSLTPTIVPAKTQRRGLSFEISKEDEAQPHGDLLADEQVETERTVDDLRLEMEIAVKAVLDAEKTDSGHYTSPSTKFDDTNTDPLIISVLEAAVRAAESLSGFSGAEGEGVRAGLRMYVPPSVADVVKQYLRVKLLYTDADFQVNGKLPPMLAGVPIRVLGSVQDTAKLGQAPNIAPIWDTDDIYLVFVNPDFGRSRRAFGALAQYRWGAQSVRGVASTSYAAKVYDHPNPQVYKRVGYVDIYDKLVTVSTNGIYVIKDVLT